MDNVSFQSRIKLTSMNAFDKEVRYGKRNYVNYPWTVKQSVISDKAATTDIYDCTAAGFTDGLKVMLLHICPSMAENSNFKKIEKFITSKLDIDSPYLQGFILGSKNFNPNSPNSPKVFDFFLNFGIVFLCIGLIAVVCFTTVSAISTIETVFFGPTL